MLITGVRDDYPIPLEEYVPLLREHADRETEIAQNVARVAAGCVEQFLDTLIDRRTSSVYVEGSPWDWGTKVRSGAQTQEAIRCGVVPHEITGRLAAPFVEAYSSRTYDELQRAFQIADDSCATGVCVVTHEYHADRSVDIAEEIRTKENVGLKNAAAKGHARPDAPAIQTTGIMTPKRIAERLEGCSDCAGLSNGIFRFLIDVIKAGEPSEEFNRAQQRKERILSSFMKIRQWTGLDPEKWILDGMKLVKMR